jgi:HK97 family phage major capsid protein
MRALAGWAAHEAPTEKDLKPSVAKRYHEAMSYFGLDALRSEICVNFRAKSVNEYRALAVNANTAGGYLVAEGFDQAFERALIRYSVMREACSDFSTKGHGDHPQVTMNDLANEGAIVPEDTTVASAAPGEVDPTFDQVVYHAWKFTSRIVLVPYELIEDGAEGFAQFLADTLAIRIATAQNRQLSVGNGVSSPLGIVPAAFKGATAQSPTAISTDDVYNLYH